MRYDITLIESVDSNSCHPWTVANQIKKEFPTVDLQLNKGAVGPKPAWTVDHIIVSPDARGQGIGSAVLRRLVTAADACRMPMVLLPAADYGGEVPRLRKLYSQFGFEPNNGRVTKPYGESVHADIMIRMPADPTLTEDAVPVKTKGWHLTSNPRFTPNPKKTPQQNSLAGDMMHSMGIAPAGLFVTDEPEYWMQAHGYERPYVAEIEGTVTNPPGTIMYKSREKFMQGEMKTLRVLTIDEYAREKFGEQGWVESYHDNNPRPVKMPAGYVGRPVSQMTPDEIKTWQQQFKQWTKRGR